MANWCMTKIIIKHDNENKLKQLEEFINEWASKNYMENDFGIEWLGNIVGNSGIGTVDENPETDLKCRGSLISMEYDENQLFIDTETAGEPIVKMWNKLLEKYLPDAELIYLAMEHDNEIYSTNDLSLKNHYIIDSCVSINTKSHMRASEKIVRETLQKVLDTTETDIAKLIKLLNDSEFSNELFVHKWNYDDVSAWE